MCDVSPPVFHYSYRSEPSRNACRRLLWTISKLHGLKRKQRTELSACAAHLSSRSLAAGAFSSATVPFLRSAKIHFDMNQVLYGTKDEPDLLFCSSRSERSGLAQPKPGYKPPPPVPHHLLTATPLPDASFDESLMGQPEKLQS